MLELHAGDMYLHPAKVPHSPSRSEGSIGLVIETKRGQGYTDTWYCRAAIINYMRYTLS
jgi:3-hydroxyanthranilate 3,4-dioxygenase